MEDAAHGAKALVLWSRLGPGFGIGGTTVLLLFTSASFIWGFPGGSDGKESTCNAGDPGSICGSGKSPGEGNDNTLQYSCLENSMHRGAWWATVCMPLSGSMI